MCEDNNNNNMLECKCLVGIYERSFAKVADAGRTTLRMDVRETMWNAMWEHTMSQYTQQ